MVRLILRKPLLGHDPGIQGIDLPGLVAIARAIEQESVRRYAALAELMERRGNLAAAAAFRAMLEEERNHVIAVDRWASGLGGQLPVAPRAFEWQLPEELSSSWDELAGSALLTPFRAFATAAENEQRAFAFYTYLSANAGNPRVSAEAEMLSREELRHAALMRRWRRKAWHLERRTAQHAAQQSANTAPESGAPGDLTSVAALRVVLGRREAGIASCHQVLAQRLRELGDTESADLLESLHGRFAAAYASSTDPVGSDYRAEIEAMSDPVHLLVAAQKPLEALSETLEAVLPSAEGDLFAEAEQAMASVVTRLAQVVLQTGHRMEARPAPAAGVSRQG